VERLAGEGVRPVLFYANGNLNSAEEWERRLEALRTVGRVFGVEVEVEPYARAEWEREVVDWVASGSALAMTSENEAVWALAEGGARCAACFRYNFGKAAAFAKRTGVVRWTTTLSVSPHKNFGLLVAAGREVAERSGTEFVEYNFALGGGFKRSVELAREYGLYRQRYCGCRM